jgi:hypothetical protein
MPIVMGEFVVDATGAKGYRSDFSAGVAGMNFWFLQMGGFGNSSTELNSKHFLPKITRNKPPINESEIDFENLWKKVQKK